MSEHYFSEQPTVASNPHNFTYKLRGMTFTFTSDSGVFSKGEVDFGSRLLIETFLFPKVEGDILDVGCGYGPIGLSIACADPDRHVDMIDVNNRAVELARYNATVNGVQNVSVFQSNLFEQVKKDSYAAILTNPPIRAGKRTVHAIFEESINRLAQNGELWIVIQKKQGAPSAIKKLEELCTSVEVMEKKKGYYIIRAKKD
ncbi:class I SAM-dependent methyltransferase [Bacillus sp. FJAT-47783]|uniref:class I SAM-dependent methyltransferase n=1 Tax=Bacillus sp. FJAT-47783 TaxID=2922712 RepID=UPI001FAD727B